MAKLIDLNGKKFGKLKVVSRENNDSYGRARWKCVCDCGVTVIVCGYNLRNGDTKSCGCYKIETTKKVNKRYNDYDLSGDYGIGYTSNNQEFFFDLEDYDKIKDYCWHKDIGGYLITCNIKKRGNTIKMHGLIVNVSDGYIPDHKNGIRHDNRKSNLRIATYAQNNYNRDIQVNNKSGVTGVRWREDRSKWESRIAYNKRIINLGLFVNKREAIEARKKAEEKYFGEWSFDNSRIK